MFRSDSVLLISLTLMSGTVATFFYVDSVFLRILAVPFGLFGALVFLLAFQMVISNCVNNAMVGIRKWFRRHEDGRR